MVPLVLGVRVLALSTIPLGATGQKALPLPKGLMAGLTLVSCSSWGQHGCGIQKQWCRAAGSAQSCLSLAPTCTARCPLRWRVRLGWMPSAGKDVPGCLRETTPDSAPAHTASALWAASGGHSHFLAARSHHSPLLQPPASLVFPQAQGKGNPAMHRNVLSAPQS